MQQIFLYKHHFLSVIPQSRTNRRRNEPCEFAYAVPSARRSQSPLSTNGRLLASFARLQATFRTAVFTQLSVPYRWFSQASEMTYSFFIIKDKFSK